ncbi:MAG TPA: hypothetical protein VKR78_02095, partial [Acidimicrobiales bacterium]|nr:hypothetical protein [Acidimicrobiales bacterium]
MSMRSLELVAGWPVHVAAAGVLAEGRSVGVAHTSELRPGVDLAGITGDPGRPFPWASVTKLCTAL